MGPLWRFSDCASGYHGGRRRESNRQIGAIRESSSEERLDRICSTSPGIRHLSVVRIRRTRDEMGDDEGRCISLPDWKFLSDGCWWTDSLLRRALEQSPDR